MILGKYNQEKTITFSLFEIDGIDLSVAATFAAGDVKIQKDEGAEANTTNLPTDEGSTYSLVLTATEMSAARIRIIIIDQTGTKVWLDTSLGIETYGNVSAEHAFDLDTAAETMRGTDSANTVVPPSVAQFNARTLLAADYFDPAADTVATVTDVTNQVTTAQINTEIDTALSDIGLDHLVSSSVTGTDVADDSIFAKLVSKSATADWDTYDNNIESLEALEGHINNIASTGAAFHQASNGSYVLTTGTQSSGTEANAETRDGIAHEHTDSAGAMDLYYIFDVGVNGVGVEVEFSALINGSNDSILVQAYDWVGAAWTTLTTLEGSNNTTTFTTDIEALFGKNTGTGGNAGLIQIRFYAASGLTTATLKVDQIFVAYAESVVNYIGDGTVLTEASGTGDQLTAIATAANLTTLDGKVDDMQGATFSTSTDSLEAIRDRGDTAWTTGAGGSSPTVIEIRQEMDSNSTQLAAIVADTNELQGDWVDGGRLDLILDAVLVDTNDLQTNQGNWLTVTGFATEAKQDTMQTDVSAILVDTATTIPAQITGLNNFDPVNDAVANVTLVATVTTNTDMRGTDSALLASSYTTNVNIATINGVTITGDGSGTPFDV